MIGWFTVTPIHQDDAFWLLAELQPAHEDAVANATAEHIARSLLVAMPGPLASWLIRRNGGAEHTASRKEVLEAALLSDFENDADDTRLQGAVVEHLWACLAPDLDGGWGRPLHVEHEHFSVIDHGGDGLSIYDFAAPDLRFRLWESKRHDAATSVTTIVSGAADQVKRDGVRYLTRMTKALQYHGDPRIEHLSGRIADLWSERDPASGVGISVGTTTTAANLPARPFQGLRRVFDMYPDPNHREGLIIHIPDLKAFSLKVRAEIMKGIN